VNSLGEGGARGAAVRCALFLCARAPRAAADTGFCGGDSGGGRPGLLGDSGGGSPGLLAFDAGERLGDRRGERRGDCDIFFVGCVLAV
jgi:hypothetical protein